MSTWLKRKADLVQDIVDGTLIYRSWNHRELDTWDEIQGVVDNILEVHKDMMMLHKAVACVGLDQSTKDRTYIEVEVTWDKDRDDDAFILFVKSDGTHKTKQEHTDAYERAMGVL